MREPKDRKGIFVRSGYSVRLAYVDAPEDPEDGEFLTGCYARVLHIRKWLLLIPLLIAALFLVLTLTFCGSFSTSPQYIAGMVGTAGADQNKPVTSVEYASYDSSSDTTISANSYEVDFRLSLPATCRYSKQHEGGNPIMSTPSLWVDTNNDSRYSSSECFYNAPDKTGYGAFLKPGTEVNRIKLTKTLKPGTYRARTVWKSVLLDGKTPAGSASFDFNLTVV